MWAISLNPICILLTCQQGNFDALVALGVVLFLASIIIYQKNREPADWLLACLLLGVATLIKTTPIVLAPLLLLGTERLRIRTKILGGVLAAGPALLGLSVIYVLAPAGVRENVLAYRSIGGYFGITGLLGLMHLPSLSSIYARAFPVMLVASVAGLAVWIHGRAVASDRSIILTAAGALLAIPLFGPGYGPQYLFWSIPLMAAVYYLTDDITLRRVFIVAYGIAAITYIFEYNFFFFHGALAAQWSPSTTLKSFVAHVSTMGSQTLVRLPMFLALLTVFVMIIREARIVGLSNPD